MESHVYLAFVVATAIMIALPGPSVLLAVAHGVSFGWRRALATVVGETMGIAVQLAVAVIGMSSLLNFFARAFELLRWAGSAYLVYLGIKLWRDARGTLEPGTSPASKGNLLIQGLVITLPNPKSLIFIAAFLPQFIDPTRPLGPQFAAIIPTFLAITLTVTSAWAVLAGSARGFLKSRDAVAWVLRVSGGLMVLSGLGLALARRGG